MANEAHIKFLNDSIDDLEQRNCFVDWVVKIKDQDPIHPKFRGKLGRVIVDDPNDDTVTVYLDDYSCCLECHRENFDIISE